MFHINAVFCVCHQKSSAIIHYFSPPKKKKLGEKLRLIKETTHSQSAV